jgi:tetratricopeptide (TPR) repeat protein
MATSSRPLLSLAMIVKNEETFLDGALTSAGDVVDEMVVVDTGSRDRTRDIARSHGASVFEFPWNDSFSDARNESLRHVRGRWVLILDADERVVPGPGWRELRRRLEAVHDGRCFAVPIENRDLDDRVLETFAPLRILPNDGSVCFRGRVHNRVELAASPGVVPRWEAAPAVRIVHYGYDPSVFEGRSKNERALPLILAELRERPHDKRYRFYHGRQLVSMHRFDDAIPVLCALLRDLEPQEDMLVADVGPVVFSAYLGAGKLAEGVPAMTRLAGLLPDHPDIAFGLALCLSSAGRGDEALQWKLRALAALDQAPDNKSSRLRHQPWVVHEAIGHHLWDRRRFEEARSHYDRALAAKTESSDGWPELLNNRLALAIEFDEPDAVVEELALRLVTRQDTALDLFWMAVKGRAARGRVVEAKRLLSRAFEASARLRDSAAA